MLTGVVRWSIASLLVALGALLVWTERPYALDLAAQFGAFAAVGAALAGVVLVAWRRDAPAIIGCLATVVSWGVTLRDYRGPTGASPERGALRIVLYNAHGNPLNAAFLEWAESERVDVLCIVESPPSLFGSAPSPIAALEHALPAGPSWRASDSVFSRYPIETVWPTEAEVRRRPVLATASRIVTLDLGGAGRLLLTTQHPPSPRTRESWEASWRRAARDGEQIRALMSGAGLPCIVAGDMNATPTGRTHRVYARASGLRGWTPLFGAGTWPSDQSRWLSLPIDRVWTSPDLSVSAFAAGPRFAGSDHRPIVVTVALPQR